MPCKPITIIPLTEKQKLLVTNNMGLAFIKAMEYYHHNYHGDMKEDELLSAAHLGLIHAVTHYKDDITDPKDHRWCKYVMKCVTGYIKMDLGRRRLIHIPLIVKVNSEELIEIKKNIVKPSLLNTDLVNIDSFDTNRDMYTNDKSINIRNYFYLLTPLQKQIILLYLKGFSLRSIDKKLKFKVRRSNYIFNIALKILREAILNG